MLENKDIRSSTKFSYKDDEKYKGYLLYNMEMYIDHNTSNITPYMMSYVLSIKDNKDINGFIGKYNLGDDLSKEIVITINNLRGNKKILLVGYNNGVFDDYIVIDRLTRFT